ncbi:beta-glucanase (GH16 family) [Arthrobacter stackebrandtii]|uniref:Beta-glucanase (GH16 family) n=1 Tax=Arthrobacter stackebrandtii TaxID=272161 RepID=A0ABS4YT78_9MICC|nr:RICIN domain-containing protein [Arthrobacter stackebrandtii]MBP2411992.1 beta-glucanase (GH16 family) [Arthrobacter stackebrandtii]
MEQRSFGRRTLFAGAAALGLFAPLLANSPKAMAAGSTWSPDHGWSFIPSLSDDFTAPASSDRWNRGLWYPKSGAGTFTDGNVAFEDGLLKLHATVGEDGGPTYRFGAVESYFDLPGVCSYVEVRAKVLDRRANVLSAIWQQSSNYDHVDELLKGADPHPEVDVEETFSFDSMVMANHTWGADGHVAFGGNYFPTGQADLSQEFHTYGIERRDGRLRFYFDRKLAWDLAAPHPSLVRMSRHQVLSLEGHLGQPNPEFLPASYDIDYVHSYYYTGAHRAPSQHCQLVNAASGLALTIDGASGMRLRKPNGRPGQAWLVQETDDFTYTIEHPKSQTMLVLENGNGQVGVPVVVEPAKSTGPDDGSSRRRWHVLPAGEDSFHILSKFSGLAMDAGDGALLQQEQNAGDSQRWLLQPIR